MKRSIGRGKRVRTIEHSPIVLTIGHSTRTLEAFIVLLQAYGATHVVDVMTVQRSRHNPQFNKAALPSALKEAGLDYVHLPALGGLRHARRDSVNRGWRNASFRGYADYMQTPEFEQSLDDSSSWRTRRKSSWCVRRSGPVALSSFAHRRCLIDSWNPR